MVMEYVEVKKLYFEGLEFIFRRNKVHDSVFIELEIITANGNKRIPMGEEEFNQLVDWLENRKNPWI